LIGCSKAYQPYHSDVSRALNDCQLAKILIERDEHARFGDGGEEDLFIAWIA
jgi:hypothetical protein